MTVYMGSEPSWQEPALPKPTPEACAAFERRAKAFEDELTILSRKHGIVVGITDYEDIGLLDPKHEELWQSGLEWDDQQKTYKWHEYHTKGWE